MSVMFTITKDAEFEGASVIFSDGTTYPVSSDHPKYAKIIEALLNPDSSEDEIFKLVAPFDAVFLNLTHLSDRVTRKGMRLFFDGDALNNSIASQIITSLDEEGYEQGTTWRSYVAFLERLMTNPSADSRDHFYKYVESHGLTITDDGMVVLYKGVHSTSEPGVYRSNNSGYGLVTTPDGKTTEYPSAQLPNGVDYVVSIPRSMVDADRRQHCSVGLHAGTFEYASSFAPVLLTVLVDPRDVVSVPNDYNNAKIRVARYRVLEVNDKKKQYKSGVVQSVNADDPEEKKIAEFMAAIPGLLDNGVKLKRFRNKSVTSKARPLFDKAVERLGFSYDG